MRDQVTIVLNEREPHKAKAAATLANLLEQNNITSSRIPITEQINNIVFERRPKIVVLDYLLGDFSTGLDIVQKFSSLQEDLRPAIFFLTDEPSISIAIEAMRLGVKNYYEIESSNSLSLLCTEITEIIKRDSNQTYFPIIEKPIYTLDDWPVSSNSSVQLIKQVHIAQSQKTEIFLLLSPEGCGQNTLAEAIINSSKADIQTTTIDLRVNTQNLSALLGIDSDIQDFKLGQNLNVIIDHAEEDTGELLQIITNNKNKFWPVNKQHPSGILFILSNDSQTINAWQRSFPEAKLLLIPELAKRIEDIPIYSQKFHKEAHSYCSKKPKQCSTEALSWLQGQTWPGNIRQLKSVITDATVNSSFEEASFLDLVKNHYQNWLDQKEALSTSPEFDKNIAVRLLETCNYNYQVASARLGCGLAKFSEIINGVKHDS